MNVIQPKKQSFHSSMLSPMCTLMINNRFVFEPIETGSSAIIEIPIACHKGAILDVKVQCKSENYDLYIYPFPIVELDSIMVTYESKGINKMMKDLGISAIWTKYSQIEVQRETHLLDIDKSLYVQIDNHGANTDQIIFELTHQAFE